MPAQSRRPLTDDTPSAGVESTPVRAGAAPEDQSVSSPRTNPTAGPAPRTVSMAARGALTCTAAGAGRGGEPAGLEAVVEAEAEAFDRQLRSSESQERLAAFLSRSKPASSA